MYHTYEHTFRREYAGIVVRIELRKSWPISSEARRTVMRSMKEAVRRGSRASAAVAHDESTSAECQVQCVDPARVERARTALPSDDLIARAASILRVLGDPTRLTIVRALATEELCVCDLAALTGQSQSTISHSLRALRQMRLVRYRRSGKIAYYAVDDAHVADVSAIALAHVGE